MNSCLSVIARTLHLFPLGGNYLSETGKFTYERKECDRPQSIPVSAMFDVWPVNFTRQHQAQLLNQPSLPGAVRKTGIRKPGTHITRAYGRFCAGLQRTLTVRSCQRCQVLNAQFPLRVRSPRKSSPKYLLRLLTAPNLSYGWLLSLDFEQEKSHDYAQTALLPPPRDLEPHRRGQRWQRANPSCSRQAGCNAAPKIPPSQFILVFPRPNRWALIFPVHQQTRLTSASRHLDASPTAAQVRHRRISGLP